MAVVKTSIQYPLNESVVPGTLPTNSRKLARLGTAIFSCLPLFGKTHPRGFSVVCPGHLYYVVADLKRNDLAA